MDLLHLQHLLNDLLRFGKQENFYEKLKPRI